MTEVQDTLPHADSSKRATAALARQLADWVPAKLSINPDTHQVTGSGVTQGVKLEFEQRLRSTIVNVREGATFPPMDGSRQILYWYTGMAVYVLGGLWHSRKLGARSLAVGV